MRSTTFAFLLTTALSTSAVARAEVTGAFTAAQAARGAELNEQYCAECHPDSDFQDAFFSAWVDQPASALFDLLRATMPQDSPGLLSDHEYTDLLAYILALNGVADGGSQLDPQSLDDLVIGR